MRRVVGSLAPFLALAALSAALTGCGGGGVAQAIDPVAAAATKTEDAGGVKLQMTFTADSAGKSVTVTGNGAFEKSQGSMDFDFGRLFEQADLQTGADQSARVVFLTESGDPVLYLRIPFLSALLPSGKSWIRLDLQKAGNVLGVDVEKELGNGATQNPTDALRLLESQGAFTDVGKETVDGVDTTHYSGTIDLQKAGAAHGVPSDVVQRLIAAGAPNEFPIDAWVDGAGYLRRIVETYDGASGSQSVSTKVTIDLSDYGTNVDVSAPPSDEVFDATQAAVSGIQSHTTTG